MPFLLWPTTSLALLLQAISTSKIEFICQDGDKISHAIKDTLETGEGRVVITNAKGYNKEGLCVSEFNVHWSFKAKNK